MDLPVGAISGGRRAGPRW